MNKYRFHATNLIAAAFEQHGLDFDVVSRSNCEHLMAGFPVECGPRVLVRFMSTDDLNDVAMRIFGLISHIPPEKRLPVLEACNTLNNKIRFLKFTLDSDGDVNVEYDFTEKSADVCIGKMALELFLRTVRILDSEYVVLANALYSCAEPPSGEYTPQVETEPADSEIPDSGIDEEILAELERFCEEHELIEESDEECNC